MNARTKYYLDKEKQKVEEIIDFVKKNKIVLGSSEYDSFCEYLKDIIKLEILANNIEYSDNKSSEINFQVVHNEKSGTAGSCLKNIFLNEDGRFVRGTVDIVINSNTNYFEKLSSDDENVRIEGAKRVIKTVHHEFSHFKQVRSFVTHLSDYRALRSAKEYLFHEASLVSSRVYQKNHDNFSIENDADLQSYIKFSYFMDDAFDSKRKLECLSKYYFSEFIIFKDGKRLLVSRDDFIDNFVNYEVEINKRKGLLMKYPILQKEYTFECKRKTLVELGSKYISELNNVKDDLIMDEAEKNSLILKIKEMYFELFNKSFLNFEDTDNIEEFIDIVGVDTLHEMIEYNDNKANDEINILKNYYLSGSKNSIKLNYKKYFAIYKGNETIAGSYEEFKDMIGFNSLDKDIQKKTENFFIPFIPECGYFLTNNNELLSAFDFFNKYFLESIMEINSIDDFYVFLDKYVQSENDLLYEIGKKRVINNNSRINSRILFFINEYVKGKIR